MITKRQLFQVYSQNLAYHVPALAGLFVCPLCLRAFGEDALNAGVLRKEHIVPSSLGGRLVTLTCQRCNNTQGSTIESHLRGGINLMDVAEGLVSHPAEIVVDGARLASDITLPRKDGEKPTLTIVGRKGKSRPEHVDRVIQSFSTGTVSGQMNFRFRVRMPNYRSAFIRMAYLMMFHYFGYYYIRFDFTKPIRELILTPQDGSVYYKPIQELPRAPAISNCIGIVHSPPELRSFIVLVTLRSKRTRHFAVQLPGFMRPDPMAIYGAMQTMQSADTDFHLFERDEAFLTEKGHANLALRLWKLHAEELTRRCS